MRLFMKTRDNSVEMSYTVSKGMENKGNGALAGVPSRGRLQSLFKGIPAVSSLSRKGRCEIVKSLEGVDSVGGIVERRDDTNCTISFFA